MKEIRGILAEYDQVNQTRTALALATVYEVKGSSYRRHGARMLIRDDGNWFGGISGGCLEGNALKRANLAMADGLARLVTYDTANDDEASIGVSLGCNGVISVIITPIIQAHEYNPIRQLRKVIGQREPMVLITVLESNNAKIPAGSVLLPEDLTSIPELAAVTEVIPDILQKGKSQQLISDSYRLFIEVLEPELQLLIMGGNYDVLPVLSLATTLGWRKIILNNPKRLYPPAKDLADEVVERFADLSIDNYSVGLIMSHDYQTDLANLKSALRSGLQYIGLLGPAVRRDDMINELESTGQIVDRSRIFGPAGLDIGAQQPEEIGLAILAEIVAVRRQRQARSLRERTEPIHDRQSDKAAII